MPVQAGVVFPILKDCCTDSVLFNQIDNLSVYLLYLWWYVLHGWWHLPLLCILSIVCLLVWLHARFRQIICTPAPPLQTAIVADKSVITLTYASWMLSFLKYGKCKCLFRLNAMFVFDCKVFMMMSVLHLVSMWWRATVWCCYLHYCWVLFHQTL